MIRIVPSISILNGKVAKASSLPDNTLLFEKAPLELAIYFEQNGFKKIGIVDLDGAREQSVVNYQHLQFIKGHTELTFNYSGGIRTDGGLALAFEHGAGTATISTIAAEDPDLFVSWMITFGRDKLVLAADVKEGRILTRGWLNQTGIELFDYLNYFAERGMENIKLTDVGRDGVLEGPNFELIEKVRNTYPNFNLSVSGGVRNVQDIDALNSMGVNEVIIARAFYEGLISIDEVQKYL